MQGRARLTVELAAYVPALIERFHLMCCEKIDREALQPTAALRRGQLTLGLGCSLSQAAKRSRATVVRMPANFSGKASQRQCRMIV